MRNLQGQKFINRVNFQTSKHHRQLLRQQIKPQLFSKLQVHENPSNNYLNAFKGVFKDQLQKTMQEHYQKKIKDQNKQVEDKMTYSLGPTNESRYKDQFGSSSIPQQQYQNQPYHLPSSLNDMGSTSPIAQKQFSQYQYQSPVLSPNSGTRFRDYFEERTNKFQNFIKNNFDGGQNFFKGQDAYQIKRQKETQSYAQTLRKQLDDKKYLRFTEREKQNMQKVAVKQMHVYQQQLDKQKYMQELQNKNNLKISKMSEVEEARQRRHRKSKQFQYSNLGHHNPITNPIQYHIDNPYILKKIQDKTLV